MTTTKTSRRMARPPYDGGSDNAMFDAERPLESSPAAPAGKRITKRGLVIDLLQQTDGASLAEIVEATGWLPHTARAALTGLRRKGHDIARSSVDGVTRYAVAPAVTQ